MGRRIRLDYANKAKAAGPPSREEVMARQQQQALAAKAGGAASGGAGGVARQMSAGSATGADVAGSSAGDLDDGDMCPLCCEPLDKTDQSFEPCDCGYQVRTYHPLGLAIATSAAKSARRLPDASARVRPIWALCPIILRRCRYAFGASTASRTKAMASAQRAAHHTAAGRRAGQAKVGHPRTYPMTQTRSNVTEA